MAITIDYYASLNSPWTYLGSAPFAEIARRHGATVNVKPAKFGPIFEQTGGLARGEGTAAQSRAQIFPLQRPSRNAAGDRGQAAGQGRPQAVAGTGPRA